MTRPVESERSQIREAARFDMTRPVLMHITAIEGGLKNQGLIHKKLSTTERDKLADLVTLVATAEGKKEFMEIAATVDKLRIENKTPNFPTYSSTFGRVYDNTFFVLDDKSEASIARTYGELRPDVLTTLARASFPGQIEVPEQYCPRLVSFLKPKQPLDDLFRKAETPDLTDYSKKINSHITLLTANDPHAEAITEAVRAGIVMIVSKAVAAENINQISRLASVADRLNSRRGVDSRFAKRILGYFNHFVSADLDEEEKTKQHFPELFINMQSNVAIELALAIYNGDQHISRRYCGPITKTISDHKSQRDQSKKIIDLFPSL